MTFSGQFEVAVNEQGRVTLPTPLKKGLGQRFFITGLQTWGFLTLYPDLSFNQMMEKLEATASPLDPIFMHVLPLIGGNTWEVTLDSKGRFTIPLKLREFTSSDMMFVGSGRTVRLFKAELWRKKSEDGSTALEMLSERLAGGANVEKT